MPPSTEKDTDGGLSVWFPEGFGVTTPYTATLVPTNRHESWMQLDMRNLTFELQLRLRTREALGQRSALEIRLTLLINPKFSCGVMYVVNVAVINGCKTGRHGSKFYRSSRIRCIRYKRRRCA